MNAMLRFLLSDDGPVAVEYAVMLALIIVFAIGSITSLGTTNGGFWATSTRRRERLRRGCRRKSLSPGGGLEEIGLSSPEVASSSQPAARWPQRAE